MEKQVFFVVGRRMINAGKIFGGLFFIVGLVVFAFTVISPAVDFIKMQSWQVAMAQLHNAEVTSYQSRNDNGTYTTMYKVEMDYRYQVGREQYVGNRPKITSISSSNSDDAYALLSKIKRQTQNGMVPIWYNPTNPSSSVYERDLPYRYLLIMTLFSATFMLVGGGIFKFVGEVQKSEEVPVNADKSKPWTTRKAWASPTIYSNAQNKTRLAWYFALLSSTFIGIFAVALFGEHPVATGFVFLAMLLPVWLAIRAYRIQKEWHFFNQVPLTLSPYPGVIGGKVGGRLTIPVSPSASDMYSVKLTCTKFWTIRTGNETRRSSSQVWSKECQIKPLPRANGSHLSFSFDVPADQAPSSEKSNAYHTWSLSVDSNLKGIRFCREYEIPVFVTRDSMTIEDELEATPLTRQETSAISDRIDLASTQNAIQMVMPRSTSSLFVAAIGTMFLACGIAVVIFSDSAFGYVFSGFASLFLGLGIWGWGRQCHILVEPGKLTVDVYFLSTPVKHHSFSTKEIHELSAIESGSLHTNGKQSHVSYGLRLLTRSGKRMDLGGEFKSLKNATHMKQQIEAMLQQG